MDPFLAIASIVVGYLMGSLSFARLMTRWFVPDQDVTKLQVEVIGTQEQVPVGVVGANAASMILGPRLGLVVALLDMLKVAVPMVAFRLWFPGQAYFLLVALAGLVGHNWPVYHRFKGGRGFSVILASFLVIDWLGAIICVLAGLFLGGFVARSLFLAYVAWLWLMIPWLWLRGHDPIYAAYAVAANVVFLIATIAEIRVFLYYRRVGRLNEYREALMASSPRWRGMSRLLGRPGKPT